MADAMVMEYNVPARMRDGITLMANVYRPAAPGRYPVLLTRLPYGKDFHPWWAVLDPARAVRAGYVVVAQDCRGRFASGGTFRVFATEAEDGFDTVAWAAALPCADGNVGMFGGSYYGFTQWAAAALRPPQLKAIAPMMTWADPRDGVSHRGGALEWGLGVHWFLLMTLDTELRQAQGRPPAEAYARTRQVAAAIDRLSAGGYGDLPLERLAGLAEFSLKAQAAGLMGRAPGEPDPVAAVQAGQVPVPSLNIGGWYDLFLRGTLDNFGAARAAGQAAHLLVGPWSHQNRGSAVQEVDFGFAASAGFIDLAADLTAVHVRWFDRWLKGAANGVDAEPPVRIFVMGENCWRHEQEWPLARTRYTPWYLHGGGHANTRQGDGWLSPEPPGAAEPPDGYTYDPANPVPTVGGHLLMPGIYGAGARDQRPVEDRPDVLVYTSAPLTAPLEVVGPVQVKLWAAAGAPDTDFVARLVDVHPDGFAQPLADGIIRARYRHSAQEPGLLEPGAAYGFTVDLWAVSNVFLPGHRVRLDITSSSFPRWDRNANTGAPPGTDTVLRPARQTVFHDAPRPSHVVLPVIPRDQAPAPGTGAPLNSTE